MQGLLQVSVSLIFLLVIHPISAALILLYAYVRYSARTLYDKLMLCVVHHLGRVPASQSNLAWKVGGPGISRPYFFEIGKEDIFVLLFAEMEKLMLEEYSTRIRVKIDQPRRDASELLSKFFDSFQANRPYNDYSADILSRQLSSAISKRRERFPRPPQNDVRFTQQELASLLRLTKQFIKAQIQLKDMNKYIWTHLGVREGDYNTLTRVLWTRTFRNSDILEPFEDLEMRFKLTSDDRSTLDYIQIRQALKGSVNIEKEYIPTISQKQVCNYQPYLRYVNLEDIIKQIILTQSFENRWSSHQNNELAVYMNYKIQIKQQNQKK